MIYVFLVINIYIYIYYMIILNVSNLIGLSGFSIKYITG